MSNGRSARGRATITPFVVGLALTGLLAACGQSKSSTAGRTATTTTVGPTSTATSVGSSAAPAPTVGSAPAAASASAESTVAGQSLPVTVQSDTAMRAAGNPGPSSSILVPSSCTVTATSATATGTYEGGFVPQVYARYGDVVDLYVFTKRISGYPDGIQLAAGPFSRNAPAIGGTGSWTVTVPIDISLGQPATCLVAAQPTHDFEGAPSAY